MSAVTVEGVVVFMRGEKRDTPCPCCPGSSAHIFTRYVDWEGKARANFDALELALMEQFLYKQENEGKRIRVTIEVVDQQPTSHGAGVSE